MTCIPIYMRKEFRKKLPNGLIVILKDMALYISFTSSLPSEILEWQYVIWKNKIYYERTFIVVFFFFHCCLMRCFLDNTSLDRENHIRPYVIKTPSSMVVSWFLLLNASHPPATRMRTDTLAIFMGFVFWPTHDHLRLIFLASNNDKLYKVILPFEKNHQIRLYYFY